MRTDIFPLSVRKAIDWHVNHACNLYLLGICPQPLERFGVSMTAICAVSLKYAIFKQGQLINLKSYQLALELNQLCFT